MTEHFHLLFNLNSVINPLIYAWMSKDFSKAFKKILNYTARERTSRTLQQATPFPGREEQIQGNIHIWAPPWFSVLWGDGMLWPGKQTKRFSDVVQGQLMFIRDCNWIITVCYLHISDIHARGRPSWPQGLIHLPPKQIAPLRRWRW